MHYKKLVKRHKTQEKQKMEEKWWSSFNSVSDLYNEVFVIVTETVLEIFRELSVSWIIFRNWG